MKMAAESQSHRGRLLSDPELQEQELIIHENLLNVMYLMLIFNPPLCLCASAAKPLP